MELGEALADAARRELMEETGVTAEIIGHAEIVELRETTQLTAAGYAFLMSFRNSMASWRTMWFVSPCRL